MTDLKNCVCIFDLDGTLVDSAPDLTAALNRALVRENLEEIDETKVRGLVGEGAKALLQRGFAMQGQKFPDDEDGERLVTEYKDDYADHIFERSTIFPGVVATLEELRERGATLAVCTNKTEQLSEPLLRQAKLAHYFVETVSSDSLPEKKPSPLPLTTIVERTGCSQAVMVGDTATDVNAAKAAGMPCLVASFGYGAGDPEIANAPHFDSYAELAALIADQIA